MRLLSCFGFSLNNPALLYLGTGVVFHLRHQSELGDHILCQLGIFIKNVRNLDGLHSLAYLDLELNAFLELRTGFKLLPYNNTRLCLVKLLTVVHELNIVSVL